MAQTVASVINDEDSFDKDTVSTDFKSAIARALNDLSATSENLQVIIFRNYMILNYMIFFFNPLNL